MADIRKYWGYVILNNDKSLSGEYLVKFPDFPELEISADRKALEPYGPFSEECCSKILDCILALLNDGLEPPTPQSALAYKPAIEVYVDVDMIRANVGRSKSVNKPN